MKKKLKATHLLYLGNHYFFTKLCLYIQSFAFLSVTLRKIQNGFESRGYVRMGSKSWQWLDRSTSCPGSDTSCQKSSRLWIGSLRWNVEFLLSIFLDLSQPVTYKGCNLKHTHTARSTHARTYTHFFLEFWSHNFKISVHMHLEMSQFL